MTVRVPAGAVRLPTRIDVVPVTGAKGGAAPLISFRLTATDDRTGRPLDTFAVPVTVSVGLSGIDLGAADPTTLQIVLERPPDPPLSLATVATSAAATADVPTPGLLSVLAATPGAVAVESSVLALVGGQDTGYAPRYLPSGVSLVALSHYDRFRVRFSLRNTGSTPVQVTPRLEVRREGGEPFVPVAERPEVGAEFHTMPEWVPAPGGAVSRPDEEDIAEAELVLDSESPAMATSQQQPTSGAGRHRRPGHHSMVRNSPGLLRLAGGDYTEVEFTVGVGDYAEFYTGYEFRISDDGQGIPGAVVATVRTGGPLPPADGLPVVDPSTTTSPAPAALRIRAVGGTRPTASPSTTRVATKPAAAKPVLRPATTRPAPAKPAATKAVARKPVVRKPVVRKPVARKSVVRKPVVRRSTARTPVRTTVLAAGGGARYALAAPVVQQRALQAPATAPRGLVATAAVGAAVHSPYSDQNDACAACHRTHAAKSSALLGQPGPRSTLCFTCHDGIGASTNVKGQYTDAAIPADNAATRSYYRHNALVTTTHTLDSANEFGGISNRHSECADCHDTHTATNAAPVTSASGWSVPGRIVGASGVAVTNGAAGTTPTFRFLDGATSPVTLEYQLCFKCHSSFTTLPSNTGFTPARYVLDKAVEFNPANASYHPVEAPGKNTSTKMADSLAGGTLWKLTVGSTVRCTQCHASDSVRAANPAASADLPPHTSRNRGILLANYRDRVLTSSSTYQAADFALCYLCHSDTPMRTDTTTATNFRYHYKHVAAISGGTGSGDIDTPGTGSGVAICAECHFRIHGNTYANTTPAQTIPGTKLVNFAPNVQAYNGTLRWTQSTPTTGTCTLVCHGRAHSNWSY